MRQEVPGQAVPALDAAMRQHLAGDLDGAERLYRAILEHDDNQPEVLNLLGVLRHQRGELAGAAALIDRARRMRPTAEFHFNLANVLRDQGRVEDAMAAWRDAIALWPDYPEAHNNLGTTLLRRGLPDAALAAFRSAVACRPDFAEAHNNLGTTLQALGRHAEAVKAFAHAAALLPGSAEVQANLGGALRRVGAVEHAVEAFRRAIALRPGYAEAHNGLGAALHALGRLPEAEAAYRTAIRHRPALVEAHNNLGNLLKDLARGAEAEVAFRTAIVLRPGYMPPHHNLGVALQEMGRGRDAVAAFRAALAIDPAAVEPLAHLVHQRQHGCDWDGLDAETDALLARVRGGDARVAPFVVLALPSTKADQLAAARHWAGLLQAGRAPAFRHAPARRRARIRLGYLSGDLHDHAIGFLTAALFEAHDRARFEVVAYSHGPNLDGPTRRRLVRAFDRFHDVRLEGHDEVAGRIHADRIDVLVDLKGYTTQARSEILVRRPAPVQASWLGYPGTMGADFIDYVVADAQVAPMADQPFYTERLVHLPHSYQPNDPRRPIAAAVPSRAACGLPEDGFVFCCFNNAYKIAPAFFEVWMRLLRTVPGSVLWLLEANAWAGDNLRREAAARGVGPERIVFAPRAALPDHLARHRLADLFLDTLPYGAHTTASDALWAGLPVLTCRGDTFAGRVGASLLHAVGLPELVTRSPDEYEAAALGLAREPGRLAAIRSRLAAARAIAPLFDAARFARAIEAAYIRMHEIRLAGEPPRAFAVADG